MRLVAALLSFLLACCSDGADGERPIGDRDRGPSTTPDAAVVMDPGRDRADVEGTFDGGPNFGLACIGHEDCPGGWCVDVGAGRLCTADCVDRCPPQWACAAVSLFGGGDRTSVCLPRDAGGPPLPDAGGREDAGGPDCGTCGDGVCDEDCGEDFPSCPGDCDVTCGNGTCQPPGGESVATCPVDCAVCGDRVCSPGESPRDCPEDCCSSLAGTAGCGDGFCIGFGCGEGPDTCPADCGTACGDGVCGRGENPEVCATDCQRFICGNGVCEPTDGGPAGCPGDCASACGDCVCQGDEGFLACPIDCGFCGDGVCSLCAHLDELAACPADCDAAPAAERCNGVDDDGDGATDEGFEGLGGACDSDDTDRCANGRLACLEDGSALHCPRRSETAVDLAERCNAVDDDCDGATDEDFPDLDEPCTPPGGDDCAVGVRVCDADGGGTRCESVPAGTEICDGLDNDCDGATDEIDCDDGNPCTRDVCLGQQGCWNPDAPSCSPDLSPGVIVALPAAVHFESAGSGCNAQPEPLVVWNRGGRPIEVTAVSPLGCGDGLEMIELPRLAALELPATIPPGDQLAMLVRWRPGPDGATACTLRVRSDHPETPELVVPVTIADRGEGIVQETFRLPSTQESDLVFLIDGSESMSEEREAFAGIFEALLANPAPGLRWRLAVTVMDFGEGAPAFFGDPRWAWPGDDGAGQRLAALIRGIGDGGIGLDGGLQRGLEAALQALTPPVNELRVDGGGDPVRCGDPNQCTFAEDTCLPTPDSGPGAPSYCGGQNYGMPRALAPLTLVFVSDEDDESADPVGFYADALTELKGGRLDRLSTFAVVGPEGSCEGPWGFAVDGTRYIDLAAALGGEVWSICSADFGPLAAAIADRALRAHHRVRLGPLARTAGLEVRRNGAHCASGFTLDVATRVLTLDPDGPCAPAPGDEIVVRYEPDCGR